MQFPSQPTLISLKGNTPPSTSAKAPSTNKSSQPSLPTPPPIGLPQVTVKMNWRAEGKKGHPGFQRSGEPLRSSRETLGKSGETPTLNSLIQLYPPAPVDYDYTDAPHTDIETMQAHYGC